MAFRKGTQAVRTEWSDWHHDLIHGPVLTYSVFAVAPIICYVGVMEGGWVEFVMAWCCGGVWILTAALDWPALKLNDGARFRAFLK
ncbi:MAG: hypothetical protein KGI70_01515 [Patescibacteria group bacterium]|nr:hypothetical protein [Patescibacteria group bacterium]